jgi:uncharacterized membrane protein
MSILILGLILFLGTHSVRIVADGWRTRTVARLGEGHLEGPVHGAVAGRASCSSSGATAQTRLAPVVLWGSPTWTRHLAALLTLPAFVLLVAAYVPGNLHQGEAAPPHGAGRQGLGLAHLVANNTLADLLLFGGFLVWSVFSYRAARQRDRQVSQVVYPPGKGVDDRGDGGGGGAGLGGLRLLGPRGLDRRVAIWRQGLICRSDRPRDLDQA